MADLSATFNPAAIATSSDAASDAASKALIAQSTGSDAASAASDALSKVGVKITGSGVAKITVGESAPSSPSAGDLWVDTSAALSNTVSDALSKIAVVSDAASSALVLAATASDAASSALAKAASGSAAASDALSKCAVISDAASKAKAESSDAISKIAVVSDAASNAQSKITARSATWDTKTVILKVYNEASAIASGDGKMYFAVPAELNGMNLVTVGGHLYTAATSGVVGVMIRNVTSGVDMLSSGRILEWDATEKDTATASASSVVKISTGADGVVTGEEIRVDIDAAGSGAKGLEIRLGFKA